jgi:hypothetical protein
MIETQYYTLPVTKLRDMHIDKMLLIFEHWPPSTMLWLLLLLLFLTSIFFLILLNLLLHSVKSRFSEK